MKGLYKVNSKVLILLSFHMYMVCKNLAQVFKRGHGSSLVGKWANFWQTMHRFLVCVCNLWVSKNTRHNRVHEKHASTGHIRVYFESCVCTGHVSTPNFPCMIEDNQKMHIIHWHGLYGNVSLLFSKNVLLLPPSLPPSCSVSNTCACHREFPLQTIHRVIIVTFGLGGSIAKCLGVTVFESYLGTCHLIVHP